MTVSLARRTTIGLAAVAASAGLVFAAVAPASATAGPTTTSFKNACWAGSPGNVAQLENLSVTVDHTVVAPAGQPNTYTIQFGDQTTPSSFPGYTFKGLSDIQYKLSYNIATLTSATKTSSGTNISSGSPTVSASGGIITLGKFGVGPSTTFKAPQITVVTTSPVFDVKLSTSGTAAEFGNFANNYFSFKANGVAVVIPVSASTSCVPSDDITGAVGSYPALNAGAGTLH